MHLGTQTRTVTSLAGCILFSSLSRGKRMVCSLNCRGMRRLWNWTAFFMLSEYIIRGAQRNGVEFVSPPHFAYTFAARPEWKTLKWKGRLVVFSPSGLWLGYVWAAGFPAPLREEILLESWIGTLYAGAWRDLYTTVCMLFLELAGQRAPKQAGVIYMENSGCSPFPICWAKGTPNLFCVYFPDCERLLLLFQWMKLMLPREEGGGMKLKTKLHIPEWRGGNQLCFFSPDVRKPFYTLKCRGINRALLQIRLYSLVRFVKEELIRTLDTVSRIFCMLFLSTSVINLMRGKIQQSGTLNFSGQNRAKT